MTTIGRGSTAKIAGACDDGTVRIYDSVTGVLRLSLRPKYPVLEMTGLPDGSLLVCTHGKLPLITLWDIQTGGLVQTHVVKVGARHTSVSLNGRYVACGGSEGTVDIWEMASRRRYPARLEPLQGKTPCWLAPEELIMVAGRGSVCIQNVVLKGPPVHKFELPGSFCSVVYSQVFDRLAIVSLSSRWETYFTILDVETSMSSTFHIGNRPLSSIAFFQTANQLVGGRETPGPMEEPGLETVDISTERRTCFNLPFVVTSVSTLSNGTVVANTRGSGIQLLSLDQDHTSPQQPTLPPPDVYLLDKGRILAIVPATDCRVILLETATMSQVFSIPAQKVRVLCASLENGIAVCCFEQRSQNSLQMWEFSHQRPRWIKPTSVPASVGSISPACTRLVTFHEKSFAYARNECGESLKGSVYIWDAHNGDCLDRLFICDPQPFDVTFDSEDRFYFHYDAGTHRNSYDINFQISPRRHDTTVYYSITHREEQLLERQALYRHYRLDDGREWVFCGSERICWVPPAYIRSTPASHGWIGSSLVVVGQDGVLRKLAFGNCRHEAERPATPY